jgi:hypothetical protein
MPDNTAVQEPDITLASTTETQAELDHATSPNWRQHFTPADAGKGEGKDGENKEKAGEAEKDGKKAATETKPASEPGDKKSGAKGESGSEKDDDEPLPKGVQKRIDRLTARLGDQERELAELRRGRQQNEPARTAAKDADPEPQQKDFDSWEKWQEARNRWVVRDEARKQSAKDAAADQQARSKENYDAHLARIEEGRTAHADYDDVVRGANMKFSSDQANIAFQLAVIECENGQEILYHLGTHPEEMEEFENLSPARVAMAVGRLSAALSPSTAGKSGSTRKPASNAPAPPTPVRRATTAIGSNYLDPEVSKKMSDDDWIAKREADVRSRKQRRN